MERPSDSPDLIAAWVRMLAVLLCLVLLAALVAELVTIWKSGLSWAGVQILGFGMLFVPLLAYIVIHGRVPSWVSVFGYDPSALSQPVGSEPPYARLNEERQKDHNSRQ